MNILNKNYITIYKKMVVTESAFQKAIQKDLDEMKSLVDGKDMELLENVLSLKYADVYQKLNEEMLVDKLHRLAKKTNDKKELTLEEAVKLTTFKNMLEDRSYEEFKLFLSEGYTLTSETVSLTEANKTEVLSLIVSLEEAYNIAKKEGNYQTLSAVANL